MSWYLHGPLCIAHQGGQGLRPTNTRLAFDEAVRLGAHVLDTDVHLTRDGHIVAIHDDTVDRTTDGTGKVRDLTLAELQRLDAGYRYTDDGHTFPYRGQGCRIPLLQELLEAYPHHPWVIELKETPREAAQVLGKLLRGHEHRVLVGSFDHSSIKDVRRWCPGAATCASQREVTLYYILSWLGLHRLYRPPFEALAIPLEWHGLTVVTPRLCRAAAGQKVAVLPWTINDASEMRRLLPLVNGLNTDRPDVLGEVLDEQPKFRV